MPAVFIYLLKLSVSLAVVFLFYYFILRKLTFYNHNRWYLLAYTVLSFLIPFINISPVLENNNWQQNQVITWIPVIGNGSQAAHASPHDSGLDVWTGLLLVLGTGILIMIVRLAIQLLSLLRLLKKAVPISSEGISLYQLDGDISPFSFGNSIYLNKNKHQEEELAAIIRHEIVHVKQKHGLDILWGEILCLLNWYNPFAWLLRHAIRQNLEFIADHQVLEKGADRKQYQYLLLKVTSSMQYSITATFRFSSLKKRIAMMNKLRSAKHNLLRFLFVLPLMAVVLVSFRRHFQTKEHIPANTARFSAIVFDDITRKPLPGVLVRDEISGQETYSDEKGYFSFDFSARERKLEKHLWFNKDGYQRQLASFAVIFNPDVKEMGVLGIGAMRPGKGTEVCSDCYTSIFTVDASTAGPVNYDAAASVFQRYLKTGQIREDGVFSDSWNTSKDGPVIRVSVSDTIPAPPAEKGENVMKDFLKRNPDVLRAGWVFSATDDAVRLVVNRKDGSREEYNLDDEADRRKAEAKYGKLPVAPPPPPPPPPPPAQIREVPISPAVPRRVSGVPLPPGQPEVIEVRGERISASSASPAVGSSSPVAGSSGAGISTGGNPVYVVNGKEVTVAELNAISPESIARVDVLKGDKATAAYGSKATDGAVVITTKPNAPVMVTGYRLDNVTVEQAAVVNPEISFKNSKKLVILDGKELPQNTGNLKGTFRIITLSKEDAVKKYGDKAKEGAIEITTIK